MPALQVTQLASSALNAKYHRTHLMRCVIWQGVAQLLGYLTPLVQQGNLLDQIEDLEQDKLNNEVRLSALDTALHCVDHIHLCLPSHVMLLLPSEALSPDVPAGCNDKGSWVIPKSNCKQACSSLQLNCTHEAIT